MTEGACSQGRRHYPDLVKPDRGELKHPPWQETFQGRGSNLSCPGARMSADRASARPGSPPAVHRTWHQPLLRVPQRQAIPVQVLLAGSMDLEVDVELPVLEEAGLRGETAQRSQSKSRRGDGAAPGPRRSPPRPPPPRRSAPGLSPRGSRWSPPGCARRASGGRTGW